MAWLVAWPGTAEPEVSWRDGFAGCRGGPPVLLEHPIYWPLKNKKKLQP